MLLKPVVRLIQMPPTWQSQQLLCILFLEETFILIVQTRWTWPAWILSISGVVLVFIYSYAITSDLLRATPVYRNGHPRWKHQVHRTTIKDRTSFGSHRQTDYSFTRIIRLSAYRLRPKHCIQLMAPSRWAKESAFMKFAVNYRISFNRTDFNASAGPRRRCWS